jgi:hypothetical protein
MPDNDTLTSGQQRLAAANQKRLRAAETKSADKLRERGWICLTPEQVAALPEAVKAIINHPLLGKVGHDTEPRRQSYSEQRPYTVADNLDDLTGPTSGVVRLPHHLDWSGTPVYNLDTPGRLASLYRAVISEAARVEDLNTWVNRDRLIELWPTLGLPDKVYRLWGERFPQLVHHPIPTKGA